MLRRYAIEAIGLVAQDENEVPAELESARWDYNPRSGDRVR